jgi:cytochrome c553
MNRRLSLILLPALAACSGASSTPPAPAPAPGSVARPPQAGLCVACHGAQGISAIPGTPHIAGQDETYLRESLLKYRSGERAHAPMKAAVGSLTDPVIGDLARYYASLPRDGGDTDSAQ